MSRGGALTASPDPSGALGGPLADHLSRRVELAMAQARELLGLPVEGPVGGLRELRALSAGLREALAESERIGPIEEQEAVLAILLEVGVLRYEDDGTLLKLADGGGYEPCLGSF